MTSFTAPRRPPEVVPTRLRPSWRAALRPTLKRTLDHVLAALALAFLAPLLCLAALAQVGAYLCTTRIDRLPSLLNVLRGEMSLVGPRPVTPAELAMLSTEVRECYGSVRPGLTGPWRRAGLGSDLDEASAGGTWTFARFDLPYLTFSRPRCGRTCASCSAPAACRSACGDPRTITVGRSRYCAAKRKAAPARARECGQREDPAGVVIRWPAAPACG
jgi:hypothetical protein